MSQIETRIAAKTQNNRFAHGAGSSQSIRKICNEELAHFNQQLLIHELIRGSLANYHVKTGMYGPGNFDFSTRQNCLIFD
jgi:hypothetical protein